MKKFWTWAKDNWLLTLFFGISILAVVFVSIYNLESITSSKISLQEVGALHSSNTVKEIVENPLYAPFKIIEYLVIQLNTGSVYLFRLIPALFGIITVFLFYMLARYWFSPLISWLSTLMYATSTLYLQHTRLAVASILVPMLLLGILWATWYMNKTKTSNLSLVIFMMVFAVALYIPGVIWFMLLAIIIQRRHLLAGLRSSSWVFLLISSILAIAVVLPLARAFYFNTGLMLDWLALPNTLDIRELATNIINVPLAITVQSPLNPVFNLGRLPIVDVLTLALMILGAYAYSIRIKLMRTRTLATAAIVSWLLIAFGKIDYAVLLPLIYLLAAGGILFLIQQWYSVFPKNPIARNVGLLLLVSVIGISVFYNLNRYFVAWQHNPATKESFTHAVPPNLVQ